MLPGPPPRPQAGFDRPESCALRDPVNAQRDAKPGRTTLHFRRAALRREASRYIPGTAGRNSKGGSWV